MINDEQARQIATACMSDEKPLTVEITIKDAWLLLSGIQLATRHPELSVYMKDALFESGLKFQSAVEAVHPEAHEFIEMGWDKSLDGMDNLDEYDGVIPDSEDDFLQFGEPDDLDGDQCVP